MPAYDARRTAVDGIEGCNDVRRIRGPSRYHDTKTWGLLLTRREIRCSPSHSQPAFGVFGHHASSALAQGAGRAVVLPRARCPRPSLGATQRVQGRSSLLDVDPDSLMLYAPDAFENSGGALPVKARSVASALRISGAALCDSAIVNAIRASCIASS
jgi:hypothetical protein